MHTYSFPIEKMTAEISKIYSCYFQVSFEKKQASTHTKKEKSLSSNILIILIVLRFSVLQNYFELDTFYMGVKRYAGK